MTGFDNTSDTHNEPQISFVHDAERRPIVKIIDGEAMADSRDVAAYFGKRHDDILKSIRNLHCSDDFRSRNFAVREQIQEHSTGASKSTFFLMTKDGLAFAAFGFTGATAGRFKEAYIAQFNAMEAELRAVAADPMRALNDPAAMRGLLLTYTEKVLTLEAEKAEMQPKVEALDRIAESDGSLCITDAAKTLQVRPKELFRFLQSHGWIYQRPGTDHWVAYQSKLAAGFLEHKTTTVHRSDGSEKVTTQCRVTPKGLTRLAQEFPPPAKAA